MSPPAVLALWVADDAEPATTAEFARVAAAAAAAGLGVALLDLREEHAAAPPLPDEAQRHLDVVAPGGARGRRPDPHELRTALLQSRSLLRLASPARPAAPELLRVTDAWLRDISDADLLRALRDAGQVVRV